MQLRNLLTAVALTALSATASATLISSHGDLVYDDDNIYIENTVSGARYLNFGAAAGASYADVLAATQPTGAFAGYSIASQADAYALYNAAGVPSITDGVGANDFGELFPGYEDDDWGVNGTADVDFVFFISAEAVAEVGVLRWEASPSILIISDALTSVPGADDLVLGFNGSWLLVADSSLASVPEPGNLALMALGLLGLGAARRKQKRS